MGGYLQAISARENERSHYPPLTYFCNTTGLTQLTPKDTYTFIPAKTHIDYWLLRQLITTQHYMPQNTKIATHNPVYGDHKALTLELPEIGDIKPHKDKRN